MKAENGMLSYLYSPYLLHLNIVTINTINNRYTNEEIQ